MGGLSFQYQISVGGQNGAACSDAAPPRKRIGEERRGEDRRGEERIGEERRGEERRGKKRGGEGRKGEERRGEEGMKERKRTYAHIIDQLY